MLRLIFSLLLFVCTIAHSTTNAGFIEYVTIPPNIKVKAKLDTGANSSSMSAYNIEQYHKNGEKWVRFEFDPGNEHPPIIMKAKLIKYVKIRKRKSQYQSDFSRKRWRRRPIVKLDTCINGTTYPVYYNLADRRDFHYPILLGRKTLIKANLIINPANSFKFKVKCPVS